MKKTLLLAGVLSLLLTVNTSFATDVAQAEKSTVRPEIKKCQECKKPPKFDKQKQEEFQNKLGLTDEQKAKAKQIHENGREQMKPVMEKMKAKHDEIKAIKDNAALSEEEKTAQIEQQVKELKALKQHSRELQMKNMKEFEGILTKDHKKLLKK
jgi:Spy/CpxP family protein refolding chaperone